MMDGQQETHHIREQRQQIDRLLKEIGNSPAVGRLLQVSQNVNTRRGYLSAVWQYETYLRAKGKWLGSWDAMMEDNFQCFKADSRVERGKHRDLLSGYVNEYLVKEGRRFATRQLAASVIRKLYEVNDCAITGHFAVSADSRKGDSIPALRAGDVRLVLKYLPFSRRLPLLVAWQSGCEFGRVLSLRWQDVQHLDDEYPLKLSFGGRKLHNRPYFTYIGRDSIEGLKAWRESWKESHGCLPKPGELIFISKRGHPSDDEWIARSFRRMALRLNQEGLVKNGDPRSWHPAGHLQMALFGGRRLSSSPLFPRLGLSCFSFPPSPFALPRRTSGIGARYLPCLRNQV